MRNAHKTKRIVTRSLLLLFVVNCERPAVEVASRNLHGKVCYIGSARQLHFLASAKMPHNGHRFFGEALESSVFPH